MTNPNPIDDDQFYADDGFGDYLPTTIDPGPWMLGGVCLYSLICFLLLPIFVFVAKNRRRRRQNKLDAMIADSAIEKAKRDSRKEKEGKDERDDNMNVVDLSRKSNLKERMKHFSCGRDIETQKDMGKEKEGKDERNDNMNVVDLSGESNLKKRMKHFSCGRDIETQKDIIDHDLVPIESTCPSNLFGLLPSIGSPSVVASAKSEKMSIASSASHKSVLSVNSRSKRRKRGKIRVLSKLDLHRQAQSKIQSELSIPYHGKKSDSDTSQDGTSEETEESNPSEISDKKINRNKGKCASMVAIMKCDRETNRLMSLGGPFTVAAVSESFFDAVTLALISNYLGIDSLSAYILVNLLIGLSDEFMGGIANSLDIVCSHAIGAENYSLAGQYVQIVMVIYILCAIPILACWWFFMGDCIRLFGMNEDVITMGGDYAKIVVFEYIVSGLFDGISTLLDVSGYAFIATVMDVVAGSMDVISIWLLLAYVEIDLFWLGAAQLVSSVVFYVLFVGVAVCRGWLDPFWSGLTKTFALKNVSAVKYVLNTAIPLTIGSLLEYGEWEVLTVFAAILGPAELAAWGIVESIWDLFEAATNGLAEAGSIRLAFHLGRGDVEASKLSSSKTLFLSTCLSCMMSAGFLFLIPYLPRWFTKDNTLQNMVEGLLPFVAIGNILMAYGMVSWSLVGAQGRFKLATSVSAIMTLCVTLPLSAGFCLGFRFSLEALVGAIVIGYSTTGLVMGFILQMSDWEGISKSVQAQHEEDEEGSDDSISGSSASSADEFVDNVSLTVLY